METNLWIYFTLWAYTFSLSSANPEEVCHTEACKPETNLKNKCLRRSKLVKNLFKERGILNFECDLLEEENSTECEKSDLAAHDFLSDYEVLKRIFQPQHYFSRIPNVALIEPSEIELSTPLAFSILCHSNIGLLEVLLSTIFRPQNSYCIYVDAKASIDFKKSVNDLAAIYMEKFPNTTFILASPTRRIFWSDVSILEAGLDCLQRLLRADSKWKFFLNTVGSALLGLPVNQLSGLLNKTNNDIVASIPMPENVKNYVSHKYRLPYDATTVVFDYHETGADSNFQYHEEYIPFQTFVKKTPAPRGLKLFYNMTESVVTRKTAEFLLHHPVAKEFREWVQDIKAPEEFFYATLARVNQTLAHNPDSNTQIQNLTMDTTRGVCPRFSNWDPETCRGKMKRWICNLSLEDLPMAFSYNCIWINKFDLKTDYRSVYCMQQYLVQSSKKLA